MSSNSVRGGRSSTPISVVVRKLDRELIRAQGLSFSQFEVLVWLRRAETSGLRMSDLASRVVLSPSGVTRAVDQLERRGLSVGTCCGSDERCSMPGAIPKMLPCAASAPSSTTNSRRLRRSR
jgi:hypothetical protein